MLHCFFAEHHRKSSGISDNIHWFLTLIGSLVFSGHEENASNFKIPKLKKKMQMKSIFLILYLQEILVLNAIHDTMCHYWLCRKLGNALCKI